MFYEYICWLSFIPMLKTKQRHFAIVAVLLFSMIAMYGGVAIVNAASMDSAKVTLGDSDLSAQNTVTVTFDLGTALAAGEYVQVAFDSNFSTIASANATCPDSGVAGDGATDVITCTGALASTTAKTITITDVTNPGTAGDYTITVSTHAAGGAEIESSQVKVYVIDDVTVTAHVDASLTFTVTGVATSTVINGDTTTGSTSPTAIDFGDLPLTTEQLMGQTLSVSTNAAAGYSVTVQQDQVMTSAGGADIDSFSTSTPTAWVAPAGTLGDESTYGYMGLASDDSDLATSFSDGYYQGLDGQTPLEVMSHDGPADGTTQDAGKANVMYDIEITALQEAGDYNNTLTYVCTPTF